MGGQSRARDLKKLKELERDLVAALKEVPQDAKKIKSLRAALLIQKDVLGE